MKREEARSSRRIVTMDKTLPYSVESVWQALTDPAAVAQWLLPGTFKPELGIRFRFLHRTEEGKRQNVQCQVVEIEAPHRLAYTWRADDEETPSLVTWTLEPVEEGTCLHLEHIGLEISSSFATHAALLLDRLDHFLQPEAATQTVVSSGAAVQTGPQRIGRIVLRPYCRALKTVGTKNQASFRRGICNVYRIRL